MSIEIERVDERRCTEEFSAVSTSDSHKLSFTTGMERQIGGDIINFPIECRPCIAALIVLFKHGGWYAHQGFYSGSLFIIRDISESNEGREDGMKLTHPQVLAGRLQGCPIESTVAWRETYLSTILRRCETRWWGVKGGENGKGGC